MESRVYDWITVSTETMQFQCERCGCCQNIPEGTSWTEGWAMTVAFRDVHKFCKETVFNQ